jgi:cytochrome P450
MASATPRSIETCSYNIAGHQTAVNILKYAIALLAYSPKWQDWVGEEIDAIPGNTSYEKAFARLIRCLAVIQETLRLYAPLNKTPRYTSNARQNLTVDSKTIEIPSRTTVVANNAALRCSPEYWGEDALIWRLDRRITKQPNSSEESPSISKKGLIRHGHGSLVFVQEGSSRRWNLSQSFRGC